jgi:hypothetical protein
MFSETSIESTCAKRDDWKRKAIKPIAIFFIPVLPFWVTAKN